MTIGQRNGISSMDAKQMNLLYKCQGASGNGGNGGAGETGGGNSGEFYACFSAIEDKAKQKNKLFPEEQLSYLNWEQCSSIVVE